MVFTKHTKRYSFAAGAAVLAISGIIVKMIGVCYKIPLMRLIGSEGMGYFNTAYDVYALLCLLSTTGLPVAVSVLINRYPSLHRRIFRLSLGVFAVLGMLGAVVVFIAADRIAIAVGAPQAAQSLRFIAPAVLFVCLSGALRGYNQAQRNMMPTAVSQVVEAAGKLLFGLSFAYWVIQKGSSPAGAASFAVLGLSAGTLLCFLYLMLLHKKAPDYAIEASAQPGLAAELIKIALPVTLGAVLAGLSKVIDLSLIMRRLQDGGVLQHEAVAIYGCYSSMVIPLFSAVPALFSSVALPLVPHLGHAIANRNIELQKEILNTAFRWCALISIPASLGIAMLSKQILLLLFSGTEDVNTAVPMLLIIAMAIPASCMITVTSAVLQAYGHPWIPMIATITGCICKAVCLYTLCPVAKIGILAAPISTVLCCIVTVSINLICIGNHALGIHFSKHWLLALAASAFSIGSAALLCRCIHLHMLQLAVCIPTTIALYFPIAFLCGLIRTSDIKTFNT